MSPPPSSLTDLPFEVLKSIIVHLPRSDLKTLRRLSKSLCACITPLLFEEIVLVSFTSCLADFRALLSSGSLGQHIRKLTYDDRWHCQFWDYVGELRPSGAEAVQDVVATYHDVETPFSKDDCEREVQLLRAVLELLPRMVEIEVLERGVLTKDVEDAPAWFYVFMRRVVSDQDDPDSDDEKGEEGRKREWDTCRRGIPAAQVIIATGAEALGSVEKLKVGGIDQKVDYKPFCGRSPFASLREVDISFNMYEPTPFEDSGKVFPETSPLAPVLMQATKLERLHLRGSTPYGTPGTLCEGRETLIRTFVRENHTFSNLRHLAIEATPMDATCLAPFLRQHSATLKSLELKSIVLLSTSLERRQECLVNILCLVKSMKLNHFATGGMLANGGNQTWHFKHDYDFGSDIDLIKFEEERNRWYHGQLTMWGCGHPGIGVVVGKMRYPSRDHSRWFDRGTIQAIEGWVLDHEDARPCPMERFAIRAGEMDYRPAREESSWARWAAYAWNEDSWDVEYRGQRVKEL